jgi:NAD(P)-dependent dehydrogenase (short-subunit alcohol dehydrogenase family)
MTQTGRVAGKVALVTGAGQVDGPGTGTGRATARLLAGHGARVVIADIDPERIEVTRKEIASSGGTATAVVGDVTNVADAERFTRAALDTYGRLDILVNNVGVSVPGSVVSTPESTWDQMLDVNLKSVYLCSRAAIPAMAASGGGSIVNIASLAGLRRIPAMPAYCSSKSGLIGLSQSVALDYGRYNIRCNLVAPGATRSEAMENNLKRLADRLGTDVAGAFDHMTRFNPLPRAATCDQITGAVVFLASDDSAMITGAVLPVDAGSCIVDPCGSRRGLGKRVGDPMSTQPTANSRSLA